MKTQLFTSTNEIDLQIKVQQWLIQNPDIEKKFMAQAFSKEEIITIIWYE